MRKFLCLVMLFVLVFTLSSCFKDEETDIRDALKISAWMIGEKYEGHGYFTYGTGEHYGRSTWIPDDGGEEMFHSEIFAYDELEVGVPRTLKMGYMPENEKTIYNLRLDFVFNGVIEVSVDKELGNPNIYLNFSSNDSVISGIEELSVNILPLGKFDIGGGAISQDTILGEEYYLNVRTQYLDGRPAVTAKIKLTPIKDAEYEVNRRKESDHLFYSNNDPLTRFVAVELVSYEYADRYDLAREYIPITLPVTESEQGE